MLYLFLENGFEETEAVAAYDMIKRANIKIKTVSRFPEVTGAHNIKIIPELNINDASFDNLEGIILPGGQPGTDNLMANEKVIEFIKYANENKLLIAAICAAPSILGRLGLLKGKKAVVFPGFEKELKDAVLVNEKVVKDGNIITAKAMGAAISFGAKIVEYFKGADKANEILDSIYE